MDSLSNLVMMPNLCFVFSLVISLPAALFCLVSFLNPRKVSEPSNPNPRNTRLQASKSVNIARTALKSMKWHQKLFFQLQNLEDHPEMLEVARDELISMLSRALSLSLPDPKGILRVEHYDAKSVWKFIEDEHSEAMESWRRYLKRRKEGQPAELFGTFEAAKAWLIQQAPVKFVDGAWLAHTHRITTPFALRSVTKNAWQVLSEELGDGDLSKHHVYLYEQLLKDVGQHLPAGHTADFVNSGHWEPSSENQDIWEAAVGQLLISLFPNEFLPEILGFNMHYEIITLDTMRAAHELRSLGIDAYYFLIHIVIDNADSGHTAMATHSVTRYLDMIRETEGEDAANQAWKRVQVGYSLSQTLGSVHSKQQSFRTMSPSIQLDPLSLRVIDIFKSKAAFSHEFHCQSRVRIGGQTLAEWLSPQSWTSSNPDQPLKLLTALSQANPWIIQGDSKNSLLIRELSWKGRMFGAFTHDETIALSTWIDSLGPRSLYWSFTGRESLLSKDAVAGLQDPAHHHPVVKQYDLPDTDPGFSNFELDDSDIWKSQPLLSLSLDTQLPDLIALWFAHIGLLENTINTPSRTATPLYASIIRILRAQYGFNIETHIVAGMDEMKRLSNTSLVDIGLELISNSCWGTDTKIASLKDVLLLTATQGQHEKSVRVVENMLCWSTRPIANLDWLLGIALAFLELKAAVAKLPRLLSKESAVVLEGIVARERQSLEFCVDELRKEGGEQYMRLLRGCRFGRKTLEGCFCE